MLKASKKVKSAPKAGRSNAGERPRRRLSSALRSKREYSLEELQTKLNYQFIELGLLKLALTHRSLTSDSNERLEFLGDAVFNLVISDYLFNKYPDAREGLLSRVRAKLVSKATLQKVAASIQVTKYLQVGPAENKNFTSRKTSVTSDAVEAIIGAVYIDGGIKIARAVILKLFKEELNKIDINNIYKDYKTRLQELIQSNYHRIPDYSLEKETTLGENAREFFVLCRIPNHDEVFTGKGPNRKEAEQDAARAALSNLADKLSIR